MTRKLKPSGLTFIRLSLWFIVIVSCFNSVLANGEDNIGHEDSCNHIIPRFIDQVMKQESTNCEEQGTFPKPGNCSVFFRCVKSGTRIQPIIEYCTNGYNFVNGVCLLNSNSSDCPQYTCAISDVVNEIGNEAETTESGGKMELTTLPQEEATNPTTSEAPNAEQILSESQDEVVLEDAAHSEQLMSQSARPESATELNKSSTASITMFAHLFLYCFLFLFFAQI